VYGGKTCHVIIDGISDGYEWSFVAVPAQVNAGVIKRHCPSNGSEGDFETEFLHKQLAIAKKETEDLVAELKKDILKLSFFESGREFSTRFSTIVENLCVNELISLKKELQKEYAAKCNPQLSFVDDQQILKYKTGK
jgi:hypothetical protein